MGIVIREVDLERELDVVRSIFNANFTIQGSLERFRWLYFDNPDGRATAWFAQDDRTGDIAGYTAVFPRRIHVAKGGTVVAWNCGDFCITPKYRTMGAAIRLRRVARDGVDSGRSPFLYAHPNERMLQVHLKVGHAPLGTMLRFARPIALNTGWPLIDRLSSAVLRIGGADVLVRTRHEFEWNPDGSADAGLTELYHTIAARLGTSLVRDASYLRWRFGSNPTDRHDILVARLAGHVTGYLVLVVRDRVAVIKDWLARDAESWNQLFAACIRDMRRRGVGSVSVIVLETHPDIPRLRRFGFMERAERSTAVAYAPDTYSERASVTAAQAWYMTVGDRDL